MKAELKYGIILGVATSCWIMVAHVLGFYTTNLQAGSYADVAITILPVVVLFLAIRVRRRRQGSLTVLQGITTGLVVVLISYVISAAFLWIYQHYINPNWLEYVIAFQQEKMAQAGTAANVISEEVSRLRSRNTAMAQIIGGLVGTLVLGLILSLILSLILRKKPALSH
jgi:hypothetical protein